MELLDKKEIKEMVHNFDGKLYYVKPEDFPDFSEKFPEKIQEVAYKIKKSDTGAILLRGELQGKKNFLIIPPFPVEKTFEGGPEHLTELLGKDYNIAIILLRLGEYSLGFFEGGMLVEHKTGTQFVGGKTRAGGQSAARYGRIREGQINDFFKKVCQQTIKKFQPHKPDFVFFGGDKEVRKSFLEKCEWLQKFRIMDRTLNIRHMKLEALKNAPKEVWKFRVYEI